MSGSDANPARLGQLRKKKIEEEARAKILHVAATAPEADHKKVIKMIERAKTGQQGAEVSEISPGMAALLFVNHNSYNRNWSAQGPKGSLEYARRMHSGRWQWNGDAIRFLKDGNVGDGQGRLGGAALSGIPLSILVAYGVDKRAIPTIDDGRARHGSDTAQLEGILDARRKESVLRHATNYLVKAGDRNAKLLSNSEMAEGIANNDKLLSLSLAIIVDAQQGIVDPILKDIPSASIAFLLLTNHWPEQTVRRRLRQLQMGTVQEPDGEKVPYFVCGEMIKKNYSARGSRDKLSETEVLGMAIAALKATEMHIAAISPSSLRTQVKKGVPKPAHPSAEEPVAAAAD